MSRRSSPIPNDFGFADGLATGKSAIRQIGNLRYEAAVARSH
jgi:hypothetical protein